MVGSALVDALRARGDEVTRLVRSPSPGPGEARWDPAGGSIDAAGIAGHDAVVHLAAENLGEKRWNDAQKHRIMDSRRQGTTLLADALAGLPPDTRPSVLVSASAIGYYGDRGDEELTETSSRGTGFLADVVEAWEASTEPAAGAGIRVVRVRSGIILSAKGGALSRQVLPFKLGLGGPVAGGRQWWSWISIDDEVGAILHCIDTASVSGPVNLVAPAPVRQREFATALGRVLGRPTGLPTPLFPLKAIYGPELVQQILLWSQRVTPGALAVSGYQFRHPDIETALRAVLGRSNVAFAPLRTASRRSRAGCASGPSTYTPSSSPRTTAAGR
jgi:uncharacterized protein (TIGR01777 family)